jgi:ATP-dependent Clp protease ATP-binding subunit ClpB
VLFDEIEKAHPDIFNVLLQVLDDGRLTDNKGRTVNFKNTIIIMTSNIGSHIIRERFTHLNEGNRSRVIEDLRSELFELLKQTIRPEFLNRIDEVIMFTPLTRNEIRDIVRLQFALIAARLNKSGYETTITEAAIDWIAEAGFDPQFGARPVKRMMQKYLLNDLSKDILAGKVIAGHPVAIDVVGDQLVFGCE